MIRKSIRLISALFLAWLVTGCAFTVHDTKLNYQFAGDVTNAKPEQIEHGVNVSRVTDERAVSDPKMIVHLVNGYGQTTSGGYAAEESITEIVKKGISSGLLKAGYKSSDDVELEAVINTFEFDSVSGFWTLKKVTSALGISITLLQDGEKIAKNTVVGKTTLLSEDLAGKTEKELVIVLFNKALDDAISQIVEVVNITLR